MARKTIQVTGFTERDAGKCFVITEMGAFQAEKWAIRALLALARSGLDVPEEVMREGMAGIARFGLAAIAGAKFEELEPLLDEMFLCVQYMPDQKHPEIIRAVLDEDIEEVLTLAKLRGEALKLHVDFSKLAGRSKSPAGAETPASSDPQTSPT